MDNDHLEKALHSMAKVILSMQSDFLGLQASVAVLKLTIAALMGEEPIVALEHFRDRETKALESLPVSQKLKELRDLVETLEKHGKSFGKNEA